jgi:hypothetical protein
VHVRYLPESVLVGDEVQHLGDPGVGVGEMVRGVGTVGGLAVLPDLRHEVDVAGLAPVPDPPPSAAAPPDLEPAVVPVGRGLLLGEEREQELLRPGARYGPGLIAGSGGACRLCLVPLPAGTLRRGLHPGSVPPGPHGARRRVARSGGEGAVAVPSGGSAVCRIPACPHDIAGDSDKAGARSRVQRAGAGGDEECGHRGQPPTFWRTRMIRSASGSNSRITSPREPRLPCAR